MRYQLCNEFETEMCVSGNENLLVTFSGWLIKLTKYLGSGSLFALGKM